MNTRTKLLTPAQVRYLNQIINHGERKYNGRARRPVERLLELGFIEADYDLQDAGGTGLYTEVYVCWPTDAGVEWMNRYDGHIT